MTGPGRRNSVARLGRRPTDTARERVRGAGDRSRLATTVRARDAIYFGDSAEFRRWLERHHDRTSEVWIGFYKKGSGRVGISYPEALDQALCFGWIDGIRKRIDDISYTNRFTPRTARSNWSAINIRRVEALTKMGLMAEPGLRAFEGRDPKRSGMYSFENRPQSFPSKLRRVFMADEEAWSFFESQPPGYRRIATWFVLSAKKDETRERRLARLIALSRARRRLEPMAPARRERSE